MLIPDFFGIFYGENEALIIIEYQENTNFEAHRSTVKLLVSKMLWKAAFFVVAQVGKAQDHTTWIWQKPSADLIGVRMKKCVLPKFLLFSHPPKMDPSMVLKRANTVLPVFGMAFDPFNVSSRFIFGKHGYSPKSDHVPSGDWALNFMIGNRNVPNMLPRIDLHGTRHT